MKPDIALLLSTGLILASLVGCSPGAPAAQASGAQPAGAIATVEVQGGTIAPLSPNQGMTENSAMSATQAQPVWGAESAEGVKLAQQDLAKRLRISVDSIKVTSVIGQEFSADAFNCQKAKERVSKDPPLATMTGWSILLNASGHRYEYHASGQTVVFCRPLP